MGVLRFILLGIGLVLCSPLLALLLLGECLFRFTRCSIVNTAFCLIYLLIIAIAIPVILIALTYDLSKAIVSLAIKATCGILDSISTVFGFLFDYLCACSKPEQHGTTSSSLISSYTSETPNFSNTRSLISRLKQIEPPSYNSILHDDDEPHLILG